MFAICVIFTANLEGSRLPYNRNRAVSLKVKETISLTNGRHKGDCLFSNEPSRVKIHLIGKLRYSQDFII